jgi:hypothetical protein
MEQEKYNEMKNELENYFSKIIKNSFKKYTEENFEMTFSADYKSHRLIEEILSKEGFDVYGMNVNMDGFQLLLDFKHEYQKINNFIFTRLVVGFCNDGNYSVYLDEDSFNKEWMVCIEDEFLRYRNISQLDFENLLIDIRKTHLMLMIKS